MSKRKTKQQKLKRSVSALTTYSASLEQKNRELRRENSTLLAGVGVKQLNQLMDTTLIQLALIHGVAEMEDGRPIGYRFEIPAPKVELLQKYRVMAERYKDEDGGDMLRIGVLCLDEPT